MEEYKLSVASSPHASSPVGTKNLMRDVLIALIPAMAMGIYVFGPRALTTTLVSVIFCEIFEWGYCKLMHKPNPCGDLSAAITGVLLVFVCPVTLPYWTIIIGDFFAIVVVKQLFGGLGTNFLNPALAGRAFLMLCYPVPMTTWVLPGKENWASVLCHRRGYRCNPPGRGLHEGRHRSRGLCAGYVHREHRRLRG
ncbi:MAG: RnfABCDGE type electron transport complex subunit D [Evtepia gabavorous]